MTETFYNLAFVFLAIMTVVPALLVVSLKNLLHAGVALFFSLTGVAGLFILLGADFLGVIQLLAYAGGILVLIIFGVFLTARIYEGTKFEVSDRKVPALLGGAIAFVVFVVLSMVISKAEFVTVSGDFKPTTQALGDLFLTKYLLPFELISILLLFVMVGAAVIVRKEIGDES